MIYIDEKRAMNLSLLFQAEKLKAQKVGREIVFSADLWYNEANEKPSSGRKVARKA